MKASSTDTIEFSDLLQKIPSVLPKLPHILSGLKQAYLRSSKTPTGLAVAFEKQPNIILNALLYFLNNSS